MVTERGRAYRNVEVLLRQETGRTGCPQDVGVRLADWPPPEELCLTRSLCGGLTAYPAPGSGVLCGRTAMLWVSATASGTAVRGGCMDLTSSTSSKTRFLHGSTKL